MSGHVADPQHDAEWSAAASAHGSAFVGLRPERRRSGSPPPSEAAPAAPFTAVARKTNIEMSSVLVSRQTGATDLTILMAEAECWRLR